MLETRHDRLGDGPGKVKAEEGRAGGQMEDSDFPSKEGEKGMAEDRQVDVYEPDPAGLRRCGDEEGMVPGCL